MKPDHRGWVTQPHRGQLSVLFVDSTPGRCGFLTALNPDKKGAKRNTSFVSTYHFAVPVAAEDFRFYTLVAPLVLIVFQP